jgi:hypothetical protein
MLVLTISDYVAPAPPNAFAEEDAARFESAYGSYDNISVTRGESPQTSSELLQEIDEYERGIRPGGPDKNVVLIYLSAHGVVNDEGEPCLLLPAHDPLDATTWLPIAKLLEALEQQSESSPYTTVLLLDANRISDAWRMGVVLNSFSNALRQQLAGLPVRNCVVLTAASDWQSATSAPELSATPFGYYAARGLRGEADGEGNDDEVVTLGELAAYLGQHVNAWSTLHRGTAQQPRMLGAERAELRLADVAGSAEIPTAPWKPPIDRQEFQQVFERVGSLERSRVFMSHPHQWAKVQFLLESLDAESLGGAAYATKARNGTLNDLNSTLADLEAQKSPPPDFKPLSLAASGQLAEANPAQGLNEIWTAWLKDPAKTKVPPGYDAAAAFAWAQINQGNGPLARDGLAKTLEFCSVAGAPQGQDYTELAMMRLLAKYVDWQSRALENSATPRRLLAARSRSEQLAAPADPRVHYIVAGSMKKADQNLAAALDRILVGDDDAVYQAEQQLNRIQGADRNGYPAIEQQSKLILRALQARDEAFSSLLHWNRLQIKCARSNSDFRSRSDIQALAEESLDLSRYLDEIIERFPEAPRPADEELLEKLTAKVEAGMNRLRSDYAERVADVTIEDEGSYAQTAIETPCLLSCPIGFDDGRLRLHEHWLERVATVRATNAQAGKSPVAADAQQDLDFLRWLAIEGARPLRSFLADEGDTPSDSQPAERSDTGPVDSDSPEEAIAENLAELGGKIRRILKSTPAVCERLRGQSASAISEQPAATARASLSLADALARRLAPIAGNAMRFRSEEDPTALLQKLDAQSWITWQGHRALDDCWGSVDAVASDSTPYFVGAAAQAADDAERLYPEATFGVAGLRGRLQDTQQIVAGWNPLIAKDLFVAQDGGPYLAHQLDFRGDSKMPSGEVAVYLTDERGAAFSTYSLTALEVRRTGVDMQKGATLDQQMQAEALSQAPVLYANSLFRGHVRQQVFSIGRGVFVDWQRPEPREATVVVRGDSKQVSQIYFVVDCSKSMEIYGDRLKDGREKLRIILDRLVAQGGQFRIGLIVYGRRAGWIEKTPGNYEVKHLDPKIYNGPPGDDVEIVFTPRPLTKQFAADINTFLAKAKPLGETPLYLALMTALENFVDNEAGSRHIVAISDGVDDVTNDPRFPVAKIFTPLNVEQSLAKNPAKIDVIEFGVDLSRLRERDRRRWPAGREAIKNIAQSEGSRGNFRLADDAASLERELLDSLRIDRYRLSLTTQEGESPPPTDWQELGSSTRLPAPIATVDYRVALQAHDVAPASIRIGGGEALQLVYRQPPENRLIFPTYDTEDRRARQPVKASFVDSYVPTAKFQDPIFRVSVQSDDERRFSQRPDIIWAKVESIEQGDPRSYYFFDPDFEPGLPVPMLNLRARNWTGSKFARVELNFVIDDSVMQQPWAAIPKTGSSTLKPRDAVLQVKSEIDGQGCRVVVDEQHLAASQDFPLQIQLDPPPDRIGRTFFDSNRSARHVFYYSVQPANPKLRALTRREIESAGARVIFDRVELSRR